MKAIGLYKYLPTNDPESFVAVEIPTPPAAEHDLLVRVKAVSVNPVDTKVRAPKPQIESAPKILGWDAAGIVEAVGDKVTLFEPGDEVYYAGSLIRPGCNSEFHLVDERIVGPKPQSLTFEQAAAMPLTTLTAWEALFDRLGIEENVGQRHSILIVGGAGGVGSIATQLAKQIAGLTVITTASRPDSTDWCKKMGADHVINHRNPLAEELQKVGFKQVEYVLVTSNLDQYIEQLPGIVTPFGSICTIVGMPNNQPVNINNFFQKSIRLGYELMFTRSNFQTADMERQHEILEEAAQLFDGGVLQHTMTENYGPLTPENLRRAHAKVEAGTMIGKLVLGGIGE